VRRRWEMERRWRSTAGKDGKASNQPTQKEKRKRKANSPPLSPHIHTHPQAENETFSVYFFLNKLKGRGRRTCARGHYVFNSFSVYLFVLPPSMGHVIYVKMRKGTRRKGAGRLWWWKSFGVSGLVVLVVQGWEKFEMKKIPKRIANSTPSDEPKINCSYFSSSPVGPPFVNICTTHFCHKSLFPRTKSTWASSLSRFPIQCKKKVKIETFRYFLPFSQL